MELRALSLFSGIGGFELAARRVGGFRVRKFVEIDPDAQTILKYHFPNIPIHPDIRDYYPARGEFNSIWGGFPCTNTSCAGNREGLKGKASSLWWEQFRVIRTVRPTFSIVEQPTGIIDRGLRQILASLRMGGYESEVEIISAASLGAGHRRERLFIVSYPDSLQFREKPTSWADQIGELVAREKSNTCWTTVEQRNYSYCPRFSTGLVQPFVPTNTPGRIRARYLAGRSVTPAQAAVALQRVRYLNKLRG